MVAKLLGDYVALIYGNVFFFYYQYMFVYVKDIQYCSKILPWFFSSDLKMFTMSIIIF